MNLGTATALVNAHPDATEQQWATLAEAVAQQPDAEFLADVFDLHRAQHDQGAGIDRARTTLHSRSRSISGRRA